ncbi:MAG: hypothetical protein V4645_09925 [Pseudomonadota bacterium]
MKISRCFALAAALCMAAVAYPVRAVAYVVHASCRWVVERVEPVLAKLSAAPTASQPRVELTAAKAFVLRLAKRERPVIAPRWRMCPST